MSDKQYHYNKMMELFSKKDIHKKLDIPEEYKKVNSWIALEMASQREDYDTFTTLYRYDSIFHYHIQRTRSVFDWNTFSIWTL